MDSVYRADYFEFNTDTDSTSRKTSSSDKDTQLYSPVALDLNRDGKIGVTGTTTSRDRDAADPLGDTVKFDIDADGRFDTIEWLDGSGDGLLVDVTQIGPGRRIDGSALFGDEGGRFENGYEKLAFHDLDGDGWIHGSEAADLAIWIDDGDARLERGELVSLAEAGVERISTAMVLQTDETGDDYMRSIAETVDGETMMTEDIWFGAA